MEAKDIEKLVRKAKDDIEKEVRDRLPRKVGVVAVNHFGRTSAMPGGETTDCISGKRREGSRAAALTQNTRR